MALSASLPLESKSLLPPRPSRQHSMRASLTAAHSAWLGYRHLSVCRRNVQLARTAMPEQRSDDVQSDEASTRGQPHVQPQTTSSASRWQQLEQQQQQPRHLQPLHPLKSGRQPGQPPGTQRMTYKGLPQPQPPLPMPQPQQQPTAHSQPLLIRAPRPMPKAPDNRQPVRSSATVESSATQTQVRPHAPPRAPAPRPPPLRPRSAPPMGNHGTASEQRSTPGTQQHPPVGPQRMHPPGTVRRTPPMPGSNSGAGKPRSPSPRGFSKQPVQKPPPLALFCYPGTPIATVMAHAAGSTSTTHSQQQQQQQQQQWNLEVEDGLLQSATQSEAEVTPMYTTECLDATDEPVTAPSFDCDTGASSSSGAAPTDAVPGSQAEVLEEQQHASNYDNFVKAAGRVAELRREREQSPIHTMAGGQRTDNWLELRSGRLTASAFSEALGFWDRNGDKRVAALWAMKTGLAPPQIANDAMKYGTSNEPTALQAYRNLVPAHLVEERTFAVLREDHVHGWLGASPDGIITMSGIYTEDVPGEGVGVLEIKCPWGQGDVESCKPDKIYYYGYYMPQIQGLMQMLNAQWCNLYVWTPLHGSIMAHIVRDDEYWAVAQDALSVFWWCHVVPAKMALAQGMSEEEVRSRYEPARILQAHLSYLKRRGNEMLKAAKIVVFKHSDTFTAAPHTIGST